MRRTIASAALVLLALCSLASVARAQTATPITLGAARQDSIAPAGTNYYSVSSAPAAPSQVLLTALAGFPTLCVSSVAPTGTQTCDLGGSLADTSSISSQVTVPAQTPVFYPTVVCLSACNFTITSLNVATSAADAATGGAKYVTLLNGVPQYGYSASGSQTAALPVFFTFYPYPAGTARTDLTFLLTPLTGAARIFILPTGQSTTPLFPVPTDSTSFTWASPSGASGGASSVVFGLADFARWPQNSNMFRIAVYPDSDINTLSFTLTASINGQSSTLLAFDSPFVDTVAPGTYEYFESYVATPGCNLTVSVTPTTGDPDLYVETDATRKFPTMATCQTSQTCRRGISTGSDSIVYRNAAVGSYYIGINAFGVSASYVVLAHLDCPSRNSAVILTDGQPINGHVDRSTSRFYNITLSDLSRDLTISCTRRSGDPDIYVSTNIANPGPTTGSQWRSLQSGADLLTISHTDIRSVCAVGRPCTFAIGVFGFTDADFTIAATSSAGQLRLIDGIAFHEDLAANQYEYFALLINDISLDITVSVTALGRGDPDLYMSVTNPRPNMTDHQWSARSYTSDSITVRHTSPLLPKSAPYVVYVSVHAYSAISFTIVATLRAPIELQLGVPQQGAVVMLEEVRYYQLTVAPSSADLTFACTTFAGSASMFISNTEQPKPSNTSTFQWSAPYYNPNKRVTINLAQPGLVRVDGMIQFYVGVQGVGFTGDQLTNYTLLAFSTDSTVSLQSGVPVTRQLSQGKFTYFRFAVETPLLDLAFVVTAITGDPDLYVSTTNPKPNQTNNEWKALNFGGDVIALPNASVGVYYIGVHAFLNSTYTLVAQLSDPKADDDAYANMVMLTDGQPQTGYVFARNIEYFGFYVPYLTASLSLQLQQQYGDPDMFISRDVNPCQPLGDLFGQVCPNAQWRANSVGADLLTINAAQPGFYIIAVHGYSIAAFTLTVHQSGTSLLLQNGIPIRGDVPRGQYDYFWLPVDSPDYDLTVTVTPLSGDPDLYLSRTLIQPNTTAAGHEASATHYGTDSISIPHTDAARFCSGCVYYFAVYGYTDATYTLSASFSAASTLNDGVPQSGSVAAGAYKYYRFSVLDPHKDITIAVTPLTGNPNLFVTSKTATYPTSDPTTYEWSSQNWYSGENLVIYHTDAHFCDTPISVGPTTRACTYVIGIYGMTAATFSIQVTSSAAVLVLRDSVPVRDWVQTGLYDYFSYQVNTQPLPGSYLTFTVTPLNGDPDLYTSRIVQFPNATSGADTRAANYFGGDSISYSLPPVGQYYIAVHAFLNTTFTLLAQYHTGNDSQSISNLVNGVPQDDLVPSHRFRYYQLVLNRPHDSLSITLNRRFGDPDLFFAQGRLPTRTDYDRVSMAYGRDLITVSNVQPGTYYVGCYGFPAQDSYYTLLASTSDAIVSLIDGSPVRADVVQGQYTYFQVFVNGAQQTSDLTISLTPLFGDPDLYVSDRVQFPNRSAYTYQSSSGGGDAVTVPGTTLRSQTYWIGVYGFANSSFTIVATFAQATQMQDGVPQGGTVLYHAMKQYIFDVQNAHADATFTLTPLQGQAFLYVSTTEQPVYGNTSTYQFSSTRWGGLQQVIVRDTPATSCGKLGAAQACRFYVGVFGNRFTVANQTTYFSLVASTSQGVVTLQDGVPFTDWTPRGQFEYFQISVPVAPAALLVSITPLTGDPDLYMSTTVTRPNTTAFTWRSMFFGADALAVDSYRDPNFRVGTYFIGVHSFTESSFSITASVLLPNATTSSRVRLINGQPQAGLLDQAGIRYYSFYVAPSAASMHRQLTITLTPRWGDPDIYVRNDGQLPTPYSYQWKADRVGRDTIMIGDTCEDCEYIVGVRAFTRSLYTLVAATADAITSLQSGVAHTSTVFVGRTEYYQITVPLGVELYIALQDLGGGDPDLLVRANSLPTIDTSTTPPTVVADFSQNTYGSDSIDIVTTTATTYYIGVYGFFNSTYSITASVYVDGAAQSLLDGQPQLGFVQPGKYRIFTFPVQDPTFSTDVSFTLTAANGGKAQFFINADCTPDQAGDTVIPTKDLATWSSTSTSRSQSRNSITLTAFTDSTTMCFNGTYIVAVFGADAPSTVPTMRPGQPVGTQFTFTASTREVQLSAGQPYFGAVTQDKYKYFAIINDRVDDDIRITLSTFGGDADLYVSAVSEFPNTTNFQWRSYSSDPNGDTVMILRSDPKYPKQFASIFIAVHGFEQSFFSLVVSTHFVQLIDGYSQNAQSVANIATPSYFNFGAADLGQNTLLLQFNSFVVFPALAPGLVPSLTAWITSVPDQTSTSLLDACATQPSAACAQKSPQPWPIVTVPNILEGRSVGIAPSSPIFCSACTYYIGVAYTAQNPNAFANFVLTASTNNTVDTLTSNAGKREGYVAAGEYHYYELFVGTSKVSTYSVIVETCSGNADLYAAQDTFTPTQQEWKWKSEAVDAIDFVPVSSRQGFTLHVGVFGAGSTPASYVISAVNQSTEALLPKPGANGALKTLPVDKGSIQVTWAQASIQNAFDDSFLKYELYYSPAAANAIMFSRCGMQQSASAQLVPSAGRTKDAAGAWSQVVSGLDPAQEYVFNVIVTDIQTQNYAVYVHSSISGSGKGGGGGGSGPISGAMLAVIIVVVIVLVLAVGYLVWRNRKLTQELDIEMHDVPKQAVIKATRGPGTGSAKAQEKYSALLQDSAIADEEDDYLPPDFSGASVVVGSTGSLNAPAGHISRMTESDRASMLSNTV